MSAEEYELESALQVLVHKATSKRHSQIDPSTLQGIKTVCKASGANVTAVFGLLYDRLKQPHSQVRLLALEVCDELFSRSKHFRSLLTARLTHFLELVVGFKPSNPLPPPAAVATALRSKALEVLERWHAQFGSKYKQVALGYNYLRNTLRYTFPDLPARAAQRDAEEREREAQALQLAAERYARLREEQPAQAREFQSFLDQMADCFTMLAEQQQQQQQQQQRGSPAADKDEGAGLEWEDVAGAAAAAALALQPEDDALPGYAVDALGPAQTSAAAAVQAGISAVGTGLAASDEGGAVGAAGPGSEAVAAAAAAESEGLLETLEGLYKLVMNRALPAVQEWLRVLVQVDVGAFSSPQHVQQEELRGAATQLHSRLVEARERYEGLQRALRLRSEEQAAAAAARAVVSLEDLFGADSDIEGGGTSPAQLSPRQPPPQQQQEASEQQQQQQQQQQESDLHRPPGASGESQQQRQEPGEQGRGEVVAADAVAGDEELSNPYATLLDPAAPKKRPSAPASGSAGGRVDPAGNASGAASGGPALAALAARQRLSSSTLPEHVLRALAEQAPVLPTGLYTHYWDSSGAPVYVSGHGLEVSNHWGPCDVHAELPADRVEELFMHTYTLPTRQQQAAASTGSGARGTIRPGSSRPGSAAAGRWPSSDNGGSVSEVASSGRGVQASAGTPAEGRPRPLGVMGGPGDDQDPAAKRARRAAERAYNEAVIDGVIGDEQLARQLHEAELARLAGQQQEEGGGNKKKAQKPKPSVRERLERKLLKGRGTGAVHRDVLAAEAERQRGKFGNRWENR